jgi:hypothetical protein
MERSETNPAGVTKKSRLRNKYCFFCLHGCGGWGLNGEALSRRSEITCQRELSEANPAGIIKKSRLTTKVCPIFYLPSVLLSRCLISTLRIFPLMVFGSSSTNSIIRGYLYGAVTSFTWFCISTFRASFALSL